MVILQRITKMKLNALIEQKSLHLKKCKRSLVNIKVVQPLPSLKKRKGDLNDVRKVSCCK
jgi:hypothetical protein